ncbi:MAG: ricin-type beta-trefoil lectin domain protein, partial [Actinoplanes sp.]
MSLRRLLALIASGTLVAGLGVLGVTTARAAEAGPVTGPGGRCLDVAGANSANGTAVQLWECNGTAAQRWTFDGAAVRALGKCLDVAAASRADGARVQIYDCNGTGAQQWTVTGGQLVNTGSDKCLDADGARLQIWTCDGGADQKWMSATTPPPPAVAAKKGVSTWQFPGLAGAMTDVGANWYYNWGTNDDSMPADAEFVPMIWD